MASRVSQQQAAAISMTCRHDTHDEHRGCCRSCLATALTKCERAVWHEANKELAAFIIEIKRTAPFSGATTQERRIALRAVKAFHEILRETFNRRAKEVA